MSSTHPTNHSLQEQESIYNLLLNLQAEVLQKMKDGTLAKDLYQHALSYVKKHKPDLEKNFVKNIGFGVSHTYPCCVRP
jgi:nucleosome binding factor SPN SPT16 subunit